MHEFDVTAVIPSIPSREALRHRALESVRAQTHPTTWILAVDTNRTGAAPTRNRALARVETEWVAFLDDDDVWYPDHIERLLAVQSDTGADLVYPWFDVEGGTDPLRITIRAFGQPVSPEGVRWSTELERQLRRNNFIPVTNLVRTELALAVGGFPDPAEHPETVWGATGQNEDHGFLLALLDAGARFAHCPHRTWCWHHWGGNTSGRPDRW